MGPGATTRAAGTGIRAGDAGAGAGETGCGTGGADCGTWAAGRASGGAGRATGRDAGGLSAGGAGAGAGAGVGGGGGAAAGVLGAGGGACPSEPWVAASGDTRVVRPQSHSRAVKSEPAVASVRPSGANTTSFTTPLWPVSGSPRGRGSVGSATSHNRAVPSAPAVARTVPSGRTPPNAPYIPPTTLRDKPIYILKVFDERKSSGQIRAEATSHSDILHRQPDAIASCSIRENTETVKRDVCGDIAWMSAPRIHDHRSAPTAKRTRCLKPLVYGSHSSAEVRLGHQQRSRQYWTRRKDSAELSHYNLLRLAPPFQRPYTTELLSKRNRLLNTDLDRSETSETTGSNELGKGCSPTKACRIDRNFPHPQHPFPRSSRFVFSSARYRPYRGVQR